MEESMKTKRTKTEVIGTIDPIADVKIRKVFAPCVRVVPDKTKYSRKGRIKEVSNDVS
jgi:hypothetical protein